jgi:hypothetical protein
MYLRLLMLGSPYANKAPGRSPPVGEMERRGRDLSPLNSRNYLLIP